MGKRLRLSDHCLPAEVLAAAGPPLTRYSRPGSLMLSATFPRFGPRFC